MVEFHVSLWEELVAGFDFDQMSHDGLAGPPFDMVSETLYRPVYIEVVYLIYKMTTFPVADTTL
jgi:hypothetical protein